MRYPMSTRITNLPYVKELLEIRGVDEKRTTLKDLENLGYARSYLMDRIYDAWGSDDSKRNRRNQADIIRMIKEHHTSKKRDRLFFSESFKSFLLASKSRPLRMLLKLAHMADVSSCNYITIRKGDRNITFHPRPLNQEFTEIGDWKREGRQEIKLRSLIVRLYGEWVANRFSNSEWEDAASSIKNCSAEYTMHIVPIDEAYSHGEAGYWARSSCMANKFNYLEMYRELPNNFEGIIFKRGTEVVGRCLRITADCGFQFYDRIYYKYEENHQGILDLLDSNSVVRKMYNGYDSQTHFYQKDRGEFYKDISIDLGRSFDYYPYADTMYLLSDDNILYNSDEDVSQGECYYELRCTDGSTNQVNNGVWDDVDGCYIDEDDAVYIGLGVQSGDRTHSDNCYWSDANDCYVLR